MIEYWLQKKTIGGWSHVTYYNEFSQAQANYSKCVGNGDSGYSWRLVKVIVVECAMLDEVVEVEAPPLEVPAGKEILTGWGKVASAPSKPASDNPWGIPSSSKAVHGLSGKVWMVHHQKKLKTRVDELSIERYTAEGWVKGGPQTKFSDGGW